ncbi:unnamed protein product, partial [Protopolystoma xenopodis]
YEGQDGVWNVPRPWFYFGNDHADNGPRTRIYLLMDEVEKLRGNVTFESMQSYVQACLRDVTTVDTHSTRTDNSRRQDMAAVKVLSTLLMYTDATYFGLLALRQYLSEARKSKTQFQNTAARIANTG